MGSFDDFRENLERGLDEGKIKVFVTVAHGRGGPKTEHLWAQPITPTTAKVLNIPFFTDAFCLGDLVEHRDGKIVGVVERSAWTFHAAYQEDEDPDQANARWRVVRDHFEQHDIPVESAYPGLFSLAVPRDIGPGRLMEIADACPVTIEGFQRPEEHHRFHRGR